MTSLNLTCSKCETQAKFRETSCTCKFQLDCSIRMNLAKKISFDKNETHKKLRNS